MKEPLPMGQLHLLENINSNRRFLHLYSNRKVVNALVVNNGKLITTKEFAVYVIKRDILDVLFRLLGKRMHRDLINHINGYISKDYEEPQYQKFKTPILEDSQAVL